MPSPAERAKRMNLVEFLAERYGMSFRARRGGWTALSPFTDETHPSFFVRRTGERWLFKDFSSGHGGSVIDFVMLKEGVRSVSEALTVIRRSARSDPPPAGPRPAGSMKNYDLSWVHSIVAANDPAPSASYLRRRGVGERSIGELLSRKWLLHNRLRGTSSCCFVVCDRRGRLQCLDNHEIGGPRKFVLGTKRAFTLDGDRLARASTVFVAEGIIDYLSVKRIEGDRWAGLALLGNEPLIDPVHLGRCRTIVAALDDDRGGAEGLERLRRRFPDKNIVPYDLRGCNDPNDLLTALLRGGRNGGRNGPPGGTDDSHQSAGMSGE